jgi:hypothetical protein
MKNHDDCWECCKKLQTDYKPYGKLNRDLTEDYSDCSAGCKHYVPLEGKLGYDWGVCLNPESRRCGLLTFEHQGCPYFEYDEV